MIRPVLRAFAAFLLVIDVTVGAIACSSAGGVHKLGAAGGGNAQFVNSQITYLGTFAGDASLPVAWVQSDGGVVAPYNGAGPAPAKNTLTCQSVDAGTCTLLQPLPTPPGLGEVVDVSMRIVAAQRDGGPAGGTGQWLCSVIDRVQQCTAFRACAATESFVTADSGADAAWSETVSIVATADAGSTKAAPCAIKAVVGAGKGRNVDWNAVTEAYRAN